MRENERDKAPNTTLGKKKKNKKLSNYLSCVSGKFILEGNEQGFKKMMHLTTHADLS